MPTSFAAPSRARLVTEAPRAGLDLAALLVTWPLLAGARRGDGHPVLVLPGLPTGDPATLLLPDVLRALGHDVHGWSLGTDRGSTGRVVRELRSRLDELHRKSGRRVSLVGWSFGGLSAQELARAAAGKVRGIVTSGSPVVRGAPWLRTLSRIVDRTDLPPSGTATLPRALGRARVTQGARDGDRLDTLPAAAGPAPPLPRWPVTGNR